MALTDRVVSESLPATLTQFKLVTAAAHKPRALVAVLHTLCTPQDTAEARAAEADTADGMLVYEKPRKRAKHGKRDAVRVIVFAGSVASAHRVALLLEQCAALLQATVHELTSAVSTKGQKAAVAQFSAAKCGCALRQHTLSPVLGS